MAINYKEIEFPEGQANLGGLAPTGFYGFIADVITIPVVPENPATLDEVSVISENIVMKPGMQMYPMYGTLEKLRLAGEQQGERDGRSNKVTLNWFIPGHHPENLGAARHFPKRRMFFLVRDHEARLRLVGSQYFPAEVATTDDTGEAVADLKGVTYEIGTYSDGPAPIYTGKIPLGNDESAGT
jgi:hypothetical protein